MTETARTDAREKRVLTATCFGHFMNHVNMLVFPALVLPMAARLKLPMGQVMGLSFWMYLLFGLTALPWGVLADRWGARPLLAMFYTGAGICALGAGLWIDSPQHLVIALAGLGLFSGIYHPAGLGWISREVKHVSRAMAYNGMAGNLGLATAPLLAGLINFIWGAGAVYAALAVLNLTGLGLLAVAPASAAREHDEASVRTDRVLVGGFGILLPAMMLGGIIYRGGTVTLPSYLELRNQNLSEWLSGLTSSGISGNVVATVITSFVYTLGIAGQFAGGQVGERFDLRWSYLGFHAVVLPVGFAMGWAADAPLILLAMVYFFFLLGLQPIENTLVARLTPNRFHHAAYGTKFVLTFGVGSLAVKMVAYIQNAAGIGLVFPALGLVSVLLLGLVGLLIVRTPRVAS